MTHRLSPRSRRPASDTLAATTPQWAVFIAMAVAGICFALNAVSLIGADSLPADSQSPRLGIWSAVSILWFAVTGIYGLRIFRRAPSGANPDQRSPAPLKTQFIAKRQQILKILAADKSTVSQSRLQISHVMTNQPSVVPPETPKRKVRKLMDMNEHRHLLVCDDEGRLIGIVSDRDVRSRQGRCVADIMTRDPFSVSPDSFVSPAVSQMLNRHFSCLPVVQDGRVCGVVTTTDMMMTLQCMLQLFDQTDVPADDGDAGSRADSTGQEQHTGAGDACLTT